MTQKNMKDRLMSSEQEASLRLLVRETNINTVQCRAGSMRVFLNRLKRLDQVLARSTRGLV